MVGLELLGSQFCNRDFIFQESKDKRQKASLFSPHPTPHTPLPKKQPAAVNRELFLAKIGQLLNGNRSDHTGAAMGFAVVGVSTRFAESAFKGLTSGKSQTFMG